MPLLYVTNRAGRHLFQKKEQRETAEPHIKRCMNSPQMSAGGRPTRVPALSNTRCRSLNAVGAGGFCWNCMCARVCVVEKLCFFCVHVRVCMHLYRNGVVRLLWMSSSPRTWPLAHCLHCCHVSSSQTGHMKPDISVHPNCSPPLSVPLYFLLFIFSSRKRNNASIKI